MPVIHCICVLLLLLAVPAAAQQASPAPPPAEGTSGYTVFLRGQPIGREDVIIRREPAGGTTLVSQSRLGPPINLVTRRAEVRYAADGSAAGVAIDAQLNGAVFNLSTTFANGSATTTGTEAGAPFTRTDAIAADTVPLPNLQFGAYEAIGRRFAGAQPGAEMRVYVVPLAEVTVRLLGVTSQRVQTGSSTFTLRRLELLFVQLPPAGDLAVTLAVDDRGGLASVNLPAQSIDVVRDDLSSPTARTLTYSNPGDEPAIIPASGFNLGATLTRPAGAAADTRLPAVILLSGSAAADRDGAALGVPTLGELAGALTEAGFLTVRYDKRGFGQSGGRAESATIQDFAQDAVSVVSWLRQRRDVDPRRIVVLGHGDGAWVAMVAAARERRIAAVVSVGAPSTTGAELVLEQQQYVLDQAQTPEAERAAKIALQKQINSAVISGRGWEGVAADVRRQADTPWFQSMLTFDPARAVERVRQPMLLVHGELDRQVPVAHVERLAAVAREERRAVTVAVVPGVNHLLIPATTGHLGEFGTLADRHVSRDVITAMTGWLTKTLPPSAK